MAMCELWCSACNKVHDPDDENVEMVKLSTIKPGGMIWIRKSKLGITEDNSAGQRTLNRKRGSDDGSELMENEDNYEDLESGKWEQVAVVSRCKEMLAISYKGELKVLDLGTHTGIIGANDSLEDDMTALHHAHEAAILYNVKARALEGKPYTFIGNVLVSVNPLQELNDEIRFHDDENRLLSPPPHPKTVAEKAYEKMCFAAEQRRRLLEIDDLERRGTNDRLAPTVGSLMDQKSGFATQFGLVNQSIVISGESGSGKTEAAKRVLSQLVAREGYGIDFMGAYEDDYGDTGIYDFQDNILGTSIVLEMFGNARTKRNPNSSRFGKMMQLLYQPMSVTDIDSPYFIYSGHICTYLLERSRVTFQEPGEANYRVFYQLLSSPNHKIHEGLGLDKAGYNFKYLSNEIRNEDFDKEGWYDMRIGLQMCRLDARAIEILQPIAAILHLGNIEFEEVDFGKEGNVASVKRPNGNIDEDQNKRKRLPNAVSRVTRLGPRGRFQTGHTVMSTVTKISATTQSSGDETAQLHFNFSRYVGSTHEDYDPLVHASKHLGLHRSWLDRFLTTQTISVKGSDPIVKRVPVEEAVRRRDALAKHVYGLHFDWLVASMNRSMDVEPVPELAHLTSFIGILDVFGFEKFRTNGFEQLLINYANEVLLTLFSKEILIGESQLYREEGLLIRSGELPGVNEVAETRKLCLELFEGRTDLESNKRVDGIFSLINKAGETKNGTDPTLCKHLHKNFDKHPLFVKPHPTLKAKIFTVKHYASEVTYSIDNFLAKNDQSLPKDAEKMFKNSRQAIVKQYPDIWRANDERSEEENKILEKRSKNKGRQPSAPSKGKGGMKPMRRKKGKKTRGKETVVGTFASQMRSLQTVLTSTSCSYIRCIKPNPDMIRPFSTMVAVPTGSDDATPFQKGTDNVASRRLNRKGMAPDAHGRRDTGAPPGKRQMRNAGFFHDGYVSRQMKNLGIYESVQVLKAGLPTRIPYPSFMQTYAKAVRLQDIEFYQDKSEEFKQRNYVAALLHIFGVDPSLYKLGKTKIFFKGDHLEDIGEILNRSDIAGHESSSKAAKKLKRKFHDFYAKKVWKVVFAKAKAVSYFKTNYQKIKAVRILQRAGRSFLVRLRLYAKRNEGEDLTSHFTQFKERKMRFDAVALGFVVRWKLNKQYPPTFKLWLRERVREKIVAQEKLRIQREEEAEVERLRRELESSREAAQNIDSFQKDLEESQSFESMKKAAVQDPEDAESPKNSLTTDGKKPSSANLPSAFARKKISALTTGTDQTAPRVTQQFRGSVITTGTVNEERIQRAGEHNGLRGSAYGRFGQISSNPKKKRPKRSADTEATGRFFPTHINADDYIFRLEKGVGPNGEAVDGFNRIDEIDNQDLDEMDSVDDNWEQSIILSSVEGTQKDVAEEPEDFDDHDDDQGKVQAIDDPEPSNPNHKISRDDAMKSYLAGKGDDVTRQTAHNMLRKGLGAPQLKPRDPSKTSVPSKKPSTTKAPAPKPSLPAQNKLNPGTSPEEWNKRGETIVVPPWQKVQLRKVKRASVKAPTSRNRRSVKRAEYGEGFASKMIDKFGGSVKNVRKPKKP